MIKDIKLRISCNAGKITSGEKSEKGLPRSLPYFNIDDFPELQNKYGSKPEKFFIYVPTDRIEDFYDCNYVKYGKNKKGEGVKIRQCDGEECLHRIDETVDETKYEAGEISNCVCSEEKECRYQMYFKTFIADPGTGKIDNPCCYLFETGSKNSGDSIYSELEKIRALNMGVLRGVPFELSVKMVSGRDAKTKFPIWNLKVVGNSLVEIQNRTQKYLQGEAQNETKLIEEKKEERKEEKKTPSNVELDFEIILRDKMSEYNTVNELKQLWITLTAEQQKQFVKLKEAHKKRIIGNIEKYINNSDELDLIFNKQSVLETIELCPEAERSKLKTLFASKSGETK